LQTSAKILVQHDNRGAGAKNSGKVLCYLQQIRESNALPVLSGITHVLAVFLGEKNVIDLLPDRIFL
jgi:hypothetical protein